MILTLRDDWEQKVTPEEAEKRNLIVDKVNKTCFFQINIPVPMFFLLNTRDITNDMVNQGCNG